MPTLLTPHGEYTVDADTWRGVAKMRSTLMGTMRRTYQLQQAYMGTRHLCGDEAPVTKRKRGTWERSSQRLDERTAELRRVLERIERECPRAASRWSVVSERSA